MTGKFSLSYKPIKDLTLTANLTPTVGTVSIKEMKKAIPVYDAYEPMLCWDMFQDILPIR